MLFAATDRLAELVNSDGDVEDDDAFVEVVIELARSGNADLALTTWPQILTTAPTQLLGETLIRCADVGLPAEARARAVTQVKSLVDAARQVRRGDVGGSQLVAAVDDLIRERQLVTVLPLMARLAGAVIPGLGGLETAIRLGRLLPVDALLDPAAVEVVLAAVGSATRGQSALDHTRDILATTLSWPPDRVSVLLLTPLLVMTPQLMGDGGRLAVVQLDADGVPTGVGANTQVNDLLSRLAQAARADDDARLVELRPEVQALSLLDQHVLIWSYVWTLAQHLPSSDAPRSA